VLHLAHRFGAALKLLDSGFGTIGITMISKNTVLKSSNKW